MRRRDFITFLAGAMAALPRAGRAQQKPVPVIGYFTTGSVDQSSTLLPAFRHGLSETGYAEGQNVTIEYRYAEGHYAKSAATSTAHGVQRSVARMLKRRRRL